MNIIIKTKNLQLTESLKKLIEKRMGGLKKLVDSFKEGIEVLVEVEKETKHHKKGNIFKAEAMISVPGKKLIAKKNSDNLLKSITLVKEELKQEISQYKTKLIEVPRRIYRKIKKDIF